MPWGRVIFLNGTASGVGHTANGLKIYIFFYFNYFWFEIFFVDFFFDFVRLQLMFMGVGVRYPTRKWG